MRCRAAPRTSQPGQRKSSRPWAAFMEAFNQALVDSGEMVETRGLTAPVHARRIQLQRGVPVVTDGPYAEAQEVLAGYWVVECEGFDRATDIAAGLSKCPGPEDASASVIDVRPIAEGRDPGGPPRRGGDLAHGRSSG
jgi:hypothetical protein